VFELCRADLTEALIFALLIVYLDAGQFAVVQEKNEQVAQRYKVIAATCSHELQLVHARKDHISTEHFD